MSTRDYVKGDFVVHWDSDLCIHCEKCIHLLPAVFNVNRKPWVDVSAASAQEIATQVDKCPSGALSWKGTTE
jgi:putative redox protein